MILLLFILAFVAEIIDSALGMMFGTILSPLLMSLGYNSYFVIPAILISQAFGGAVATYRHHMFKNGDFRFGSEDTKAVVVIAVLGIVGVILGVWLGSSVSKEILRTYISLLCIIMGALVLLKKRFKFRWRNMYGIGFVSSFNKALSGGGFGPLVTSSQVIFGRQSKNSISVTDFAEIPICLSAFVLWVFAKGVPNIGMTSALIIGSSIGAYIGPKLLFLIRNQRKVEVVVGVLVIILGMFSFFKFQV